LNLIYHNKLTHVAATEPFPQIAKSVVVQAVALCPAHYPNLAASVTSVETS